MIPTRRRNLWAHGSEISQGLTPRIRPSMVQAFLTDAGRTTVGQIRKGRIEGETNWKYEGENVNPFDVEHQELFAAVRSGEVINNANYMVGSSLMALLAQTVCQTGQEMTWEQIVESETSVELPRYAWDVEPPVKPNERGEYDIAIPGIAKYA